MILVYEPQCRGVEHAEINASILIYLITANPGMPLTFYAEGKHFDFVVNAMKRFGYDRYLSLISCVKLNVPDPKKPILNRFVSEIYRITKLSLGWRAQVKKYSIFVLSATSATLIGFKLVSSFFDTPIYIVLHGILESIKERPKSLVKRLSWFRNFLPLHSGSPIFYITTAGFIRDNLLNEFPKLKGKVFSLDFPYVFDCTRRVEVERRDKSKVGRAEALVLTSAGVGSFKKGTGSFFKLAEDINFKVNGRFKFIYAGKIDDPTLKKMMPSCVSGVAGHEMLTVSQYQEILLLSDILVFCYPRDSYRFGISGVFLDAIIFEKPVLAIRNDFFEYCEVSIGKIGWLCNDPESLKEKIYEFSEGIPIEDVEEIKRNFRKFKENMNVDSQSRRLKNMLVYGK